jgi:hypothetical protein
MVAILYYGCIPPGGGGHGAYYGSDYEPRGVPSYRFYDGDTYLREGVDLGAYDRIAVLYVGKTHSSAVVQEDDSNGEKEEDDSASKPSSVTSTDTLFYSNALAAAFAQRGASLVERNKINALVLEQRLASNELMDLSDKEKAQRLGKLLKADLLIQGNVFVEKGGYRVPKKGRSRPFFSDTTGITVSAIDAATGEVVWLNTTLTQRYISSRDLRDDPEAKGISHGTMVNEMMDKVITTFYGG